MYKKIILQMYELQILSLENFDKWELLTSWFTQKTLNLKKIFINN